MYAIFWHLHHHQQAWTQHAIAKTKQVQFQRKHSREPDSAVSLKYDTGTGITAISQPNV